MPITVIDKANGYIIQKVVRPDGSLVQFQTVPDYENDLIRRTVPWKVTAFPLLSEARKSIGAPVPMPMTFEKETE